MLSHLKPNDYKLLFDNSPCGFHSVDKNGVIVYMNATELSWLDYTADEVIGKKKLMELLSVETVDTYRNNFIHFMEKGIARDVELQFVSKSGKVKDVLVNAHAVYDDSRQFVVSVATVVDMTDRKATEKALFESEQKFRYTFDQSPVGVAMVNLSFKFIRVNATFCDILGYTEADLKNKTFADITHPDHAETDKLHIRKMVSGEIDQYTTEKRYVAKNGEIVWAIVLVRLIRDQNGQPLYFLPIVQNITKRKKAEELLKKQELHFQDIVELAVDAILLGDPVGTITGANLYASSLSGYARNELLGRNINILFSDNERKSVPMRYDLLKQGLTVRNERNLTKKDGSLVPIEMNTKMMPDGTYQTFIRDMTERKQIEDALRKSEEKFSKAFMTSPDSININRLSDGVYIEINEGFTKITGYTKEDVLGRSSLPGELGIWVNKEDRDRLVEGIKAKGEVVGLEAQFRRKDGTILLGMMSARCLEINGEQCLLSITRDMTEKHRTDMALQNTQKLESLGVLAGGIAHDFNNLLLGIFGYMDLATYCGDAGPLTKEYLASALDVSGRAKALTHQLLTFAKGGNPVKKPVDIVLLLKNAVRFALSGSNVKAEFTVICTPLPCKADENQINQVIDNLLINARQAMPLGGTIFIVVEMIETVSCKPVYLPDGTYVKFTIRDQGTGIAKDIQQRIFDPFFTTKQQGSGLGLATSFSIVKKHDGLITVESEIGHGAEFSVYLPVWNGEIRPAETVQAKPAAVKHGRVLLMDDEASVRDLAQIMLRRMGYQVVLASRSSEAIDLFKQANVNKERFDALILDLTIPGGPGGKETLVELLKIDPEIKAIASSGYSDDPVMANPGEYGFSATLAKPYLVAELAKVMGKL